MSNPQDDHPFADEQKKRDAAGVSLAKMRAAMEVLEEETDKLSGESADKMRTATRVLEEEAEKLDLLIRFRVPDEPPHDADRGSIKH